MRNRKLRNIFKKLLEISVVASVLMVYSSVATQTPQEKMKPAINTDYDCLQSVYEDPDVLQVNTDPG